MPKLTIDNQPVEVPEGATILDAAAKLGIRIPTLCFLRGQKPCTSCYVCVVQVAGKPNLSPACATAAEEGLVVHSETPDVHAARQAALELLLSDHVGDCQGPCESICPAHMDIPAMLRQIVAGNLAGAIATVKAAIALPAVLGRICPAPCEKGCRRGSHDSPVSIMLLKRYVADADLAQSEPYRPPCRPDTGKKIAIVGAGPAGLAAAYYLRQLGHGCTLFDQRTVAGGGLRQIEAARLPGAVLMAEIDTILRLGVTLRTDTLIGREVCVADLRHDFDAVILACGKLDASGADRLGVAHKDGAITIHPHTGLTSLAGVFAGGDAVRDSRLAVRAVADGRHLAQSVDAFVRTGHAAMPHKDWTIHIGALRPGEMERFLVEADPSPRQEPLPWRPAAEQIEGLFRGGFGPEQARRQASRCLHCDCRKKDACRLRDACALYTTHTKRYKSDRRQFEQIRQQQGLVYEPAKCILCGLCVQIAAGVGENPGLAFIGRGFTTRVGVPFGKSLDSAVAACAEQLIQACPTGALARLTNEK